MRLRIVRSLILLGLIGLFVTLALVAIASTTGIVSGIVTDAKTGAKLSGVNIGIVGTNLTTVTDNKGYFVITNVPPGAHEVTASMVGYGDESKSDVQVTMDSTTSSDFLLVQTAIVEKEKVATAIKMLVQPNVAPTLYVVTPRQYEILKTQPNATNQIPGLVSSQPGVTMDAGGLPHIRGGRQDEIGYMIEGIPVTDPQTNLFGTNTVTVGMKMLQLMTGGFRPEYGNATSGVINEIKKTGADMTGLAMDFSGGDQSYKGGTMEFGGVAPSGFNYYASSYSWKSQFEKSTATGVDSSDNVAKFVYPKDKDTWTLLLNQGTARYYMDAMHDYTYRKEAVTPEKDHTHQHYNIAGLTYSHNFSSKSFLTIRPYMFTSETTVDATSPDGLMGVYQHYHSTPNGLQTEYTNQISENHLVKFGANVIQSKNSYLAWGADWGPMLGHDDWGDLEYSSHVNTTQTGLFVQDQAKLGSRWRAEYGLRHDSMKFHKQENADVTQSQTSPRLGLTYLLNKKTVLKSTWGKFIQFPPSYLMERIYANPSWEAFRPGNQDLNPQRSTSWDVSFERQISSDTLFRLTPFSRTYTDLIQNVPVNPNDPMSMATTYVNSGKGKSSGVETYLSKKMNKNWEGWVSYTWMKARANASNFSSQIDPNVWSLVDWDQRHTVNVAAAYKHKTWEHDFILTYGSGLADSVTFDTVQFQKHAPSSIVLSWNILKKLPEKWGIGNQIYLNVWNVFNTGKATHYVVWPDGTREAESWVAPRFISVGIQRKF